MKCSSCNGLHVDAITCEEFRRRRAIALPLIIAILAIVCLISFFSIGFY